MSFSCNFADKCRHVIEMVTIANVSSASMPLGTIVLLGRQSKSTSQSLYFNCCTFEGCNYSIIFYFGCYIYLIFQ